MFKKWMIFLHLWMVVLIPGKLAAQSSFSFDKYHSNEEIQQILEEIQQKNPDKHQLHTITTSPGGHPIQILEIGSHLENVPAIFVGANFEGHTPLATEGALRLAQMVTDSSEYLSGMKWYFLAQPNPDAAAGFFAKPKYNRRVNDFKINNDMDEALNEDGFDDLNGDDVITLMRVKSLKGTHIISEKDSRIMVKADPQKGERGIYKMMTEGLDNDNDGKYNEDGEGGINPGIAFPHLFPGEKKEAGLWSGQSPEVYNILRFIYDRPQIAMVFTLGRSNFCLTPPKGGRKGDANLDKIKIPSRYARVFGVDASRTYSMDEVIKMLKENAPDGMEVTPSTVAGMLGLGVAVNPLKEDLVFYEKFAEEYKGYLKKKDFSLENLEPEPAQNGSFELWAYYHLGVPSFSMNLFTVPKVKEKKAEDEILTLTDVEKMEKDEFIDLGEEKIAQFLKEQNVPERMKARGIMEMMQSGKLTPGKMVKMIKSMGSGDKEKDKLSKKDKALLAWSEKEWNGEGFVEWEKVDHPDFEKVEVGGYVPYLETTPREERIDSLLNAQLPWLLQITNKRPVIGFSGEKLTDLGAGVYKLELFIENSGELAWPIAMGERNNQPAPVVLVLEGDMEILEGLKRTPLGSIGANQVKKHSWLIKTKKSETVTVKMESVVFGTSIKTIKTGGKS